MPKSKMQRSFTLEVTCCNMCPYYAIEYAGEELWNDQYFCGKSKEYIQSNIDTTETVPLWCPMLEEVK